MPTKQVKTANEAPALAQVHGTPQNIYISVRTFDEQGKTVGERIVDLCHYNTRNWIAKHLWWSATHGYCTEVDIAKPQEIEAYLANGKLALAAKFNNTPSVEPTVEVIQAAA